MNEISIKNILKLYRSVFFQIEHKCLKQYFIHESIEHKIDINLVINFNLS